MARLRLNDIVKANVTRNIRAGTFFEDIPGFTLYAERVHGGGFQNVLISDRSNPAAPVLALARDGRLEPLGTGDEMRLVLGDGEIHREETSSDRYVAATFREGQVPVGLGTALSERNSLSSSSREKTVAELLEAARTAPEPAERRRMAGYLHRRIATPMAIIAFALLAVPLATTRKVGRAFGVTATFLVVVVQYLLMRSGEIVAQKGGLPAALSLEVGNALLALVGIALIAQRARRGVGAVR
jgi:lipopolysaccharide export system permease protein